MRPFATRRRGRERGGARARSVDRASSVVVRIDAWRLLMGKGEEELKNETKKIKAFLNLEFIFLNFWGIPIS